MQRWVVRFSQNMCAKKPIKKLYKSKISKKSQSCHHEKITYLKVCQDFFQDNLSVVWQYFRTIMPNSSVSLIFFWICSKYVDHVQYFLNVVWPFSNTQVYKGKYYFWPCSKNSTMFKKYWTWGAFNDYVSTILPFFDHHLPLRGHF
jgi:hypothetical protein